MGNVCTDADIVRLLGLYILLCVLLLYIDILLKLATHETILSVGFTVITKVLLRHIIFTHSELQNPINFLIVN
jgi:hypothetical protein